LDNIDVYLVDPRKVTDERLLAEYASLLSEGEVTRWRRFKFPSDRHDYLVSHALLRVGLSRHADVNPALWTFVTNEYGRPEIAAAEAIHGLRFNLSHTRGLAAVVVAKNRCIGIDVENMTRELSIQLSDAIFSQDEIHKLQRLPEAQRRSHFFDLWTLKEAYAKARGMGHALPFRKYSFDFDPLSPTEIVLQTELEDLTSWRFELHRPTAEHRLALAYEASSVAIPRVTIRHLTPLGDCR
jgi:4'-phosphopantetheinyl transferase